MTTDRELTQDEKKLEIYYEFAKMCVLLFDRTGWIDKSGILTEVEKPFFHSVTKFIRDEVEREVRIEELQARINVLAEWRNNQPEREESA